jgi:hypothetical protein
LGKVTDRDIESYGLTRVEGFDFPVYVSDAQLARAQAVGERATHTLSWLSRMVDMPPPPSLYVLSEADWLRAALIPAYGIPHVNRRRIVVPLRIGGPWNTLVPGAWNQLSCLDRRRIRAVYGSPPDVTPFVELLISHELTHLADRPGHLDADDVGRGWGVVPRVLWFVELFANVGLHGYVSDCEPAESPRLETLFEVIGSTPSSGWPISALSEMYQALTSPDDDGSNYCWYEFRLQQIARRLWDRGGASAFSKLHTALQGPVLNDDDILEVLADIDGKTATDVSRWMLRG